jgi:hypothetical protein
MESSDNRDQKVIETFVREVPSYPTTEEELVHVLEDGSERVVHLGEVPEALVR